MFDFYKRIARPTDVVEYSNMILQQYERNFPGIVNSSTFVGFKILLKDMDAFLKPGVERIKYLETYFPDLLRGTGCFIRETNNRLMPDGFWLITLPVPIHQLCDPNINQVGRMFWVLDVLEKQFNIVRQGRLEVNVSGRCTVADTATRLESLHIPSQYEPMLVHPQHSAYSVGIVHRISNTHMLLRTTWAIDNIIGNNDQIIDLMLSMSNYISGIFR